MSDAGLAQVHPGVPEGDGAARTRATRSTCWPRCPTATELLGGLLLRGRAALPPLAPARAAGGARRDAGLRRDARGRPTGPTHSGTHSAASAGAGEIRAARRAGGRWRAARSASSRPRTPASVGRSTACTPNRRPVKAWAIAAPMPSRARPRCRPSAARRRAPRPPVRPGWPRARSGWPARAAAGPGRRPAPRTGPRGRARAPRRRTARAAAPRSGAPRARPRAAPLRAARRRSGTSGSTRVDRPPPSRRASPGPPRSERTQHREAGRRYGHHRSRHLVERRVERSGGRLVQRLVLHVRHHAHDPVVRRRARR